MEHDIKVAVAKHVAMAAPPAVAVAGGDHMLGLPHSFWLFIFGLLVLMAQLVYWGVQIWIKVKRERERVAAGAPPVTTDAANL